MLPYEEVTAEFVDGQEPPVHLRFRHSLSDSKGIGENGNDYFW